MPKPERDPISGALIFVKGPYESQLSDLDINNALADISVNAKAFGAKGDGVTDDTAAIEAALNSGARKVILQNLTGAPYMLSSGLVIPENVTLESENRAILRASGDHELISHMRDNSAIVGIVLDGADVTTKPAITIGYNENLRIEDNEFRNLLGRGLFLYAGSGIVRNNVFDNIGSYGMYVHSNKRVVLEANELTNIRSSGIYVLATSDYAFSPTFIRNNRLQNISNEAGGTGEYGNGIHCYRVRGVHIENNHIDQTTFSGVRLVSCADCVVMGNLAENFTDHGIYVEFSHRETVIANNTLRSRAEFGINAPNADSDGRNTAITGNVIHDTDYGINAESKATIVGNVIDVRKIGVTLGYGTYCFDLTVTGNTISDSQATPTMDCGIAILKKYGTETQRTVNVFGNTVTDAVRTVTGFSGYFNPKDANGNYLHVPAYARVYGNVPDVTTLDRYKPYSAFDQWAKVRHVQVGELPYYGTLDPVHGTNVYQAKLRVEVFGGGYSGQDLGTETFTIGAGGDKRVYIERRNGRTRYYDLKIYDDGTKYIVCIVTHDAWWSLGIRSWLLNAVMNYEYPGYEEWNCEVVDVTGMTDVTADFPRTTTFLSDDKGNFGNATGGWNNGHLLLGAHHIWVDATGKARIKNGAPISDTDGTVIGTQV